MERPHLRLPRRFLTRTLPLLAALTAGIAVIATPPSGVSESQWSGRGCVSGESFTEGSKNSGLLVSTRIPDTHTIVVSFANSGEKEIVVIGRSSAKVGDEVEVKAWASRGYHDFLGGKKISLTQAEMAVQRAVSGRKIRVALRRYSTDADVVMDVVQPQSPNCAS